MICFLVQPRCVMFPSCLYFLIPTNWLTPVTACMRGVFPSSSSVIRLISAPWASASAITGRLRAFEALYSSSPELRSLTSSGSEVSGSASSSASPLESSDNSHADEGKTNYVVKAMQWLLYCNTKGTSFTQLDSPSSVTLSTTEPNTRMSVLPSVLPPKPLSLLRPAGPGGARKMDT